jgi:hypothetical protein
LNEEIHALHLTQRRKDAKDFTPDIPSRLRIFAVLSDDIVSFWEDFITPQAP